MARGVDGREVFIDDLDRRAFLRTAERLKNETPYTIMAYCLMGNHFHFAIKVESTPLSRIMHRLLTAYVLGFNARHDREGHLFQARYKSFLCLDDSYLIALIRYIHMNPVRANMVSSPADWPWSSHRHYARLTASPLVDTNLYGDAAGIGARDDERRSANADENFNPWPEARAPSALLRDDSADIKSLDQLASELFPGDWEALRSRDRRRALSNKKSIVAAKAVANGHSLASIAAWMNCTASAIHHLLYRNK
jgi:REP element-mobilizing transposase RayT